MHREEEKLIAQLRQSFGADRVTTLHPDDLDSAAVEGSTVLVLTMDAGNTAQAIDLAGAANDAVARNPRIGLVFGISGCANDRREIDQIPEACASLQALFSLLSRDAFWRFDIEHQALMLVAAGYGHRDGTQLHVPPELVKDPHK